MTLEETGEMLAWSSFQLLERLEKSKKKEQCPPPHNPCRFICKDPFSSFLWHTSVTRKVSQKRTQTKEREATSPKGNSQLQILSFDPDTIFPATQGKFFKNLDWKHCKSFLNLGFKNKVDEGLLVIRKATKKHDSRRKVSAITEGWVQPFSFFFPRKHLFMLLRELFILMKTSKTRSSHQWNKKVGLCYTTRCGIHLVLRVG